MPAVTWIQGKDLVTVNLAAGAGINSSVLTVGLASGNTTLLPAAPFYLFFPGNVGIGETPEFIYVTSKSGDNLLLGPPPFGNTGGTGRAALRNDVYTAASHPGGAVLELRSSWEMFLQLQTQMGAHQHLGVTGDGALITTNAITDLSVTTGKLALGAATGVALGSDVVILTGTQTITGAKTFNNLIITAMTITLGSDATNDTYYRNSSGNLARLAPPTNTDFVMGHLSGVPTWGYPPKRWARSLMLMGA